ncbi:MAG: hypothetical protein H7210_13355 [Pyrinomonadaceae bacterium]|nr:hypothetical protein [Phycisphaerales bacterium]
MTTTPPITRRAHAKVNLALSVGPPLPPGSPTAGYHPIASWMACIDLADELTFSRLTASASSTYSITFAPDAPKPSPVDWPIEKDLAVRAHRLLESTLGTPLPSAITIRKRIPVGGGLGGGSSDAATTLIALRDLFRLDLTNGQLASLSSRLGSDIAFFLDDAHPAPPALVTGLGDELERFPRLQLPILLVIPPMGCPTRPVYKAYDQHPVPLRAAEVRRLIALSAKGPGDGYLNPHELFNDLAAPACRVEPQLQGFIDRIRALTPLPVHVTGSGSTLFIMPPTRDSGDLARAETAIRRALPQLIPVMTRIL